MRKQILLILLVACTSSYGQELKDIESTKQKCSEGAKLFGQNKVKESFSILAKYWPMPKAEIDNLIYQTDSQLKMVSTRFGKILGSDYIKSEIAGDSFVRHTYTIKFEKHAVRYLCVFYKPQESWLVNSIIWDDSVELLF